MPVNHSIAAQAARSAAGQRLDGGEVPEREQQQNGWHAEGLGQHLQFSGADRLVPPPAW